MTYNAWLPRFADPCVFVVSCSHDQAHAFVDFFKTKAKDVLAVRELVWVKVGSNGQLPTWQGGHRYSSTNEVLLAAFIGQPEPSNKKKEEEDVDMEGGEAPQYAAEEGGVMYKKHFPFKDDPTLPQSIKDSLRVTSPLILYEAKPYKPVGSDEVLNHYDKGFGLTEHLVGVFSLLVMIVTFVVCDDSYFRRILVGVCLQVLRFTRPGDCVAELCGGSGPLSIIALKLGRHALYCELDDVMFSGYGERYYDEKVRMENYVSKPVNLPDAYMDIRSEDRVQITNGRMTKYQVDYVPSEFLLAPFLPSLGQLSHLVGRVNPAFLSDTALCELEKNAMIAWKAAAPIRVRFSACRIPTKVSIIALFEILFSVLCCSKACTPAGCIRPGSAWAPRWCAAPWSFRRRRTPRR